MYITNLYKIRNNEDRIRYYNNKVLLILKQPVI